MKKRMALQKLLQRELLMNIEEEVKSLKDTVETLSYVVALIGNAVTNSIDEAIAEAKEKEEPQFEAEFIREFSDDEAKLIADVLWEYLHNDPAYNPVDERMVRLTSTGSFKVREVIHKIYEMYPEPDYGESNSENFDYMRWPL